MLSYGYFDHWDKFHWKFKRNAAVSYKKWIWKYSDFTPTWLCSDILIWANMTINDRRHIETETHFLGGMFLFKFHWLTVMMCSGSWLNIKMTSYQYRKPHCGDKTILRPSYLHNGISYAGKMSYLCDQGPGDGLAHDRWWAITWNADDSVYSRINT